MWNQAGATRAGPSAVGAVSNRYTMSAAKADYLLDGSNLAWLRGPPPSLQVLDEVVGLLAGLDPAATVAIVCDASLPHQLAAAESERWWHAVATGRHLVAAPGTDADVMLLELARRWSCTVVSRDRFDDWPELRVGVPVICPELEPDGRIRLGNALARKPGGGLTLVRQIPAAGDCLNPGPPAPPRP